VVFVNVDVPVPIVTEETPIVPALKENNPSSV